MLFQFDKQTNEQYKIILQTMITKLSEVILCSCRVPFNFGY